MVERASVMTFSVARPDVPELHPDSSESPGMDALATTTGLLKQIVTELKALRPLAQTPTAGTFNLSPDAASGNNGRVLYGSPRIRLERIVLIANGAVTFSIIKGGTTWLTLPATQAATTVILDLPLAMVLERGDSLQIGAGVTTWAAYAIGYPE